MLKGKPVTIGIISILSLMTILSCRPKRRPQRTLGKMPTLTVTVGSMSEWGAENFTYHLTGCVEAEGQAIVPRQEIVFRHKKLKKDLGGCSVVVRGTDLPDDIVYTSEHGILWVSSEEFAISQNEENLLVATVDMKATYESSKYFSLKVAVKLPDTTKKVEKASGTLTCDAPIGDLSMNNLKFDKDLKATDLQERLKLPNPIQKISCSKISINAVIDGSDHAFERSIETSSGNSFTPIAQQTMALNGGNPYLLELVQKDTDDSENSSNIDVSIQQCPKDKPWLDTTEVSPVCKPCPDDKPIYHEGLNRCVSQ
ncbi:MAG: hypothetical protein R3B45_02510 [Bdellovibrionota bacterium]